MAQELGGTTHLQQGLVVTTLAGVGALSSFLARKHSSRHITLYGTTALAARHRAHARGAGGRLLLGLHRRCGGRRIGLRHLFLGHHALDYAGRRAGQAGRALRLVFVVSYLAFGIPAVIAGIAAPHIGLATTTHAYGGLVVALSGAAALLRKYRSTD